MKQCSSILFRNVHKPCLHGKHFAELQHGDSAAAGWQASTSPACTTLAVLSNLRSSELHHSGSPFAACIASMATVFHRSQNYAQELCVVAVPQDDTWQLLPLLRPA